MGAQRRHTRYQDQWQAVMVDNATVVKTDMAASNGIIHVIDAVIIPPDGN